MIYFCGDLHGKFDQLIGLLETALKPDAIVMLGDMDAPLPMADLLAPLLVAGVEVRLIPGNHDTYKNSLWETFSMINSGTSTVRPRRWLGFEFQAWVVYFAVRCVRTEWARFSRLRPLHSQATNASVKYQRCR